MWCQALKTAPSCRKPVEHPNVEPPGWTAQPSRAPRFAARTQCSTPAGATASPIYTGRSGFRPSRRSSAAALESGSRLVLLPQTYGPFNTRANALEAGKLIRRAHLAYSRDVESLEVVRQILGPDFDAERHRAGVDMAFALERQEPSNEVRGLVRVMVDC